MVAGGADVSVSSATPSGAFTVGRSVVSASSTASAAITAAGRADKLLAPATAVAVAMDANVDTPADTRRVNLIAPLVPSTSSIYRV